jgi:hypothetical protein
MDISLPRSTTQVRAHQWQITQKCHPSRLTRLSKHILSLPTHTHAFFTKPGGQGMGITNKGGYPTMFSVSKSMQFYKAGHWVVFIKTRTETCIEGWSWTCHHQTLAGGPDRSTVPRVRGRRTGPRSLGHGRDLPRSLRVLRHKQTGTQSSEGTKSLYRWVWFGNNSVTEVEVISLGGFLMAWLKLY